MTTFLLSLLPVSLGIWCLHILFQEGHLLEKAGDWMDEHWHEKINKPLWACPICMSSIWGVIGFCALDFLFGVHHDIKLLIPFIFCLCGFNTLLLKLTSKDRILKEIDTEVFGQLFDLFNEKKVKN
jgi:hypothetical protein